MVHLSRHKQSGGLINLLQPAVLAKQGAEGLCRGEPRCQVRRIHPRPVWCLLRMYSLFGKIVQRMRLVKVVHLRRFTCDAISGRGN